MITDLNLYKVFYVVAKCENISRAAEKLYISQPAVSKSIKTLEKILNVTLFTRSSKGVRLTKEGQMFFSHIEKAYREITVAEDLINKIKNKETGTINLGVSSILGRSYFIPKLENFILKYPKIKVKIINKPTIDDLNLIKDNKLDLAIVSESFSDDSIEFIKLQEAKDIFIASPSYIKKILLNNENDIFSKGSFMLLEKENITRKHIDNYFYSIGKAIVPDIEASNMNFLIDCAKMGLGITSVFVDFVKEDLKNGALIELPLNTPIPTRYIGIAYNNNMPISYAASTLIDYLKNA